MTTISAKVILDSISPEGIRLTTVHLHYPRCIHSELMTHRVFSRNARSSRAVPVKTIIQEVMDDPFIPLHWGKNQKGMQASEETNEPVLIWYDHDGYVPYTNEEAWLFARDKAVACAKRFNEAGYHKQIVNRLLEPFAHIDVLVTSTSWANFFALRDHEAAEPHIAILAREVKAAMESAPLQQLATSQWHLPYVTSQEYYDGVGVAVKLSVARCARISYKPFDGDGSVEKELQRYQDLVGAKPLHASPAEHQARPDYLMEPDDPNSWAEPSLHGNLRGWCQFRKMLPGEFVPD